MNGILKQVLHQKTHNNTKGINEETAIINFYNEKPLSVDLPNQIKCKIETTDVALKGQTVSSSYKPATLTNGINIQVPPFIESGDEIIIDTRTIEYIKKSKFPRNSQLFLDPYFEKLFGLKSINSTAPGGA